MKTLLTIILIIFFVECFAQTFNQPMQMGTKDTRIFTNGTFQTFTGFTWGFNYPDTTFLNTEPYLKYTPGIVVRVNSTEFWVRTQDKSRWVQVGGGGGSGNLNTVLNLGNVADTNINLTRIVADDPTNDIIPAASVQANFLGYTTSGEDANLNIVGSNISTWNNGTMMVHVDVGDGNWDPVASFGAFGFSSIGDFRSYGTAYLLNTNLGGSSDSILVIASDNSVKAIARTSLITGTPNSVAYYDASTGLLNPGIGEVEIRTSANALSNTMGMLRIWYRDASMLGPEALLHMSGNDIGNMYSRIYNAYSGSSNGSAISYQLVDSMSGKVAQLYFGHSTNVFTGNAIMLHTNSDFLKLHSEAGPIDLAVGALNVPGVNTVVRVTTAARVGIGTLTPGQKLAVIGSFSTSDSTIFRSLTTGSSSDSVLVTSGGLTKRVLQSAIVGTNIYNSDGTVTVDRTATLGANDLNFIGNSTEIRLDELNSAVRLSATNFISLSAGFITISNPATSNDTTTRKILVYNTSTNRIEKANWSNSGGGAPPLSTISAALASNSILNSTFAQTWDWDQLRTGNALTIAGGLTGSTTTNDIRLINLDAGDITVQDGHTFYGVYSDITTAGGVGPTTSRNIAIYANAANSITNHAIFVNAGTVNLNPLTATTILGLNASKNIVSAALSGLTWDGTTLTVTGGATTWNGIADPTGDQALAFGAGESSTWTNSNTTEDLFTVNSSTITTSSFFSLNRTGTALANGNNIMELSSSGANGTNAITSNILVISNLNTNATSGTNVGINVTALGATTDNLALLLDRKMQILPSGTGTAELKISSASGGAGAFSWITTYDNARTCITDSRDDWFIRINAVPKLTIGSATLRINAGSTAYNTQIESDADANALYVNGTTGFTGFGTASANSKVHTTSFATAYVAKTATYTATDADHTIEATANTFTITLPTAVGIPGRQYVITNSGAGTITLATTSSQVFVNVTLTPTTLTLGPLSTVTVVSNNAAWLRTTSL